MKVHRHKRLTECNNDYTKTGTKASNRMNNNNHNIACVRGSPMVTLVGNICTTGTNLITNGTIGKEIGANGKSGNAIGTSGTNVTNQWNHWENPNTRNN